MVTHHVNMLVGVSLIFGKINSCFVLAQRKSESGQKIELFVFRIQNMWTFLTDNYDYNAELYFQAIFIFILVKVAHVLHRV